MTPSGRGGELRRLLEAGGYRLEDRPVGLLAVRRSDGRGLLVVEGDRSPVEVESEFPPGLIHRTLLYAEEPGAAGRELAAQRGMEILGPSSIGPALGELLLLGPSRSPGADDMSTPSLETPPQLVPEGERAVRPRLSRSDAEARSGVDASRFTLRLVPFYVATYRVRLPGGRGPPAPAVDHLAAVNAITGVVEIWEANEREIVPSLAEPAARLEPKLDAEQARSLAESAARERHAVSVDHTEQLGGVVVIERRRVPPGPDDLRVAPAVLVYVPYWYVESASGRVVLDAVTGAQVPEGEPDLVGPP